MTLTKRKLMLTHIARKVTVILQKLKKDDAFEKNLVRFLSKF